MPEADLRDDDAGYDELEALEGHANWAGLPWTGRPTVRRRSLEVEPGQRLSFLAWGEGPPEVVYLHGGGQNAHTWDTVAFAVGRPAVAVDLPGHGHSSWRDDRDYWAGRNAEAVATFMDVVAPDAQAVVGMSLGGLTTIRLAAARPDLVRRAVVVDVTPGVMGQAGGLTSQQRNAIAVMGGPPEFDSFEDMLAALAATMPHRPPDTLRSGLRHNARQREDGKWTWRHDLRPRAEDESRLASAAATGADGAGIAEPLWNDLAAVQAPVLLVRGGVSPFVGDDQAERFLATASQGRVEVVDGAGHSVQADRPVQLAGLIESFLAP
jgi:pimeloyl-ACP methyl ester carboxylesterase